MSNENISKMTVINLPHKLYPTQLAVLNSKARYILYSGGFGSGKTLTGCYWSFMKMVNNTASTGMIMSNAVQRMLDNIINPAFIPLLEEAVPNDYQYKKSFTENLIKLGLNDSTALFRAFNDEGALRGKNVNWIWIDEAISLERQWLNKQRFNQIRTRLREGADQQILITTNPGPRSHFLYEFFFNPPKAEKDQFAVFFANTTENKSLGAEYIMDMERTYTPDELSGMWTNLAGAVFSEFSREKHLMPFDINPNWELIVANDFGYTNPFASLLVGVDSDNNFYIIDEIYQKGKLAEEHAKTLDEKFFSQYTISRMVSDPENPSDRITLERHLQDKYQFSSIKAYNNVQVGIMRVKRLLHHNKVKVHPRCENFLREIESHSWEKDTKSDGFKQQPEKKDNHSLDAFRYCVSLFRSMFNDKWDKEND